MHLVPQDEVLEKLAAIRSADTLGRQFAQERAVEKLAGMAGVFMAHVQTEEGMDKLAQSMVIAGELSLEEYEMLKEAGLGSLIAGVKGAAKGVGQVSKSVGKAIKATAVSAKNRVGGRIADKVLQKTPKPTGMPGVRYATSKPPASRVIPNTPAPTPAPGQVSRAPLALPGRVQQAAPAAPPARPQAALAQTVPMPPSGRVAPAALPPAQAASTAMQEGRVVRRVRGTGRKPQQKPPVVETRRGQGPRQPGQVTPKQQVGNKGKGSSVVDTAVGVAENLPKSTEQEVSNSGDTGRLDTPKGYGWKSALPWMTAGGLGYGLYKGVPWAAKQLEQSSTVPMAYGGGWSPVPYGYGYSPYGPGMPTMGVGV